MKRMLQYWTASEPSNGEDVVVKRWFRNRRGRPEDHDGKRRNEPQGWMPPPPIEYLVRAKDGNDWDLLVDDVGALVPVSFRTQVDEDTDVLNVRCADWSVEYSAEDPGWQLSFSASANQVDAWQYATEVAEQLTTATGVAAYAVQIAGFDGGIFHCDEAFGIESRNVHVFAGTVVHGEVEPSMNVSMRLNSSTAMCLRINGIEEIRDPDGGARLGLTRSCNDADELDFLLSFGVQDESLEVTHRPCDDDGL